MKKEDVFYGNLIEIANIACEMARELNAFLLHYDGTMAEDGLRRLHEMGQKADGKRRALTEALARAFVTPVDRGDLIRIGQQLADVLDAVEDVMMHLCVAQIKQLRPDALRFSELIVRCCEVLLKLMEAFKDARKSGKIGELISKIIQLEEDGDRLYMGAMKTLHTVSVNPLEVVIWRDVFGAFENVGNKCGNVADLVEAIVIENG